MTLIFREMVDGDYTYFAKWLYFLPLETIMSGGRTGVNRELYQEWYGNNHLLACGAEQINDEGLWDIIQKALKPLFVQGVAYDVNRLGGMRHKFEDWYPEKHFAVFGKPDSLTYPMLKTEGLIQAKKLVWDENPVTSWCFANCGIKVVEGHTRRCMPVRGNEVQKIDGVLSYLNGLKAALLAEDPVRMKDLESWYD